MIQDVLFEVFKFCTFAMTGVIWIVQRVHYPSFYYIAQDKKLAFHHFHQKSITWVVLPLMVVEMVLGLFFVYFYGLSLFWSLQMLGILLVWMVTFFVSVPFHKKLLNSEDDDFGTVDRLVRTNWMRTSIWTLRSLGLLFFV